MCSELQRRSFISSGFFFLVFLFCCLVSYFAQIKQPRLTKLKLAVLVFTNLCCDLIRLNLFS